MRVATGSHPFHRPRIAVPAPGWKLAAIIAATLAIITASAGAASAGTTSAAAPRAALANMFVSPVTSGVSSHMCLDVYHGGTANYTNVDIYQCNNTAAQRWTFVPVEYSGNVVYAYVIEAGVGSNMCLDDYHSQISNYDNVDVFQCNGTAAQNWYY